MFTRDTAGDLASGWTQVAKLTAGDGAAHDYFGESVAISGDTIVVGANYDDDMGDRSGMAFVFTRDSPANLASNWTEVTKLNVGTDYDSYDNFGISVSIDGDTIVVGSIGHSHGSGAAYVFRRTNAGMLTSGWTMAYKLRQSPRTTTDTFGNAVLIDGDTIVVGMSGHGAMGTKSGAAVVFTRNTPGDLTSSWSQRVKLTANDGSGYDEFGKSMSFGGNTIVVVTRKKSVYVYRRTAGDLNSGWTQVAKIERADAPSFGQAISIDGETAVVGVGLAEINNAEKISGARSFTPCFIDLATHHHPQPTAPSATAPQCSRAGPRAGPRATKGTPYPGPACAMTAIFRPQSVIGIRSSQS